MPINAFIAISAVFATSGFILITTITTSTAINAINAISGSSAIAVIRTIAGINGMFSCTLNHLVFGYGKCIDYNV